MSVLLSLLSTPQSPDIYFPQSLAGRVFAGACWLGYLLVILGLIRRWRRYNRPLKGQTIWVLVVLILLTPLTSLFIGLRLQAAQALSPLNLPLITPAPVLMFFAAVPWILAGGMLGPLLAAILGAFSGVLIALWGTHNLFTPLETALLAVLFSAAVSQRYRTRAYSLLRHPILATTLLTAIYPLIFLIGTSLSVEGSAVIRLDYALTRIWPASTAMAGELLVAGLIAELVALGLPSLWVNQAALVPSPSEKSLQARFLYGFVPIMLFLAMALMAGDWWVSENAARRMLSSQMAETARLAAEGIPYFLNVGQSTISKAVDDQRLNSSDPAELETALEDQVHSIPFFTELYLLDTEGNLKAGYPPQSNMEISPQEKMGLERAQVGELPFQYFTIRPSKDEKTARLSFLAPVKDQAGKVTRVLVGRTTLDANPLSKPVLTILGNLKTIGGLGLILDDDGKIIYHPESTVLFSDYSGRMTTEPALFDEAASDGTRNLVFFQPVDGSNWKVVLSVPAQRAQLLALSIALPLMLVILILGGVAWLLLRFSLGSITSSLESLAIQAGNISQGQLDKPVPASGEDEVGQLRRAFEQMRVSLKLRLDELNRLLLVSQGVASSLEVESAIRPVLEAALSSGASSARVVLAQAAMLEISGDGVAPASYGLGPASNLYGDLDTEIMNLTRQQDWVAMANLSRTRVIHFKAGAPRPKALLAVALRHENQYYGSLWIAHDEPHQYSDEEVRFYVTLAGYAGLAAANARLFMTAEIGRQRLSAILASTPDPVLVTDQQNRLMLTNPAAWRVLGFGVEWDEAQPIERVIKQEELLKLLLAAGDEPPSVEVGLPDGKVYYASVSTIQADGKKVGRVCVLRDITHFKELDTLKSDFVATVSHDLRSPLTLIRGYASMLDMVGGLNEQQINYVRKIISGVDSMARLVTNLLDLGRIEAGVGLQLEMVSAKEVVERVVSSLQIQAAQKHVQLSVDIPQHTIPLLEADQALLQQAIHNLVDNAIKYTESGGHVQVRIHVHQERMVFEVRDTGIGIAPVDQPRLFEKFYRGAQPGAKQQRGSGLGLAIVKSIAERHGGGVWIESQLGKGSVFYLAIPLRSPERANV
jgi:two-component system, OmpR family, phosphate regulon sensor histidine kinase PhoR